MTRARLLGLAVLLAIPFAPAAGRAASTPSRIVFSATRPPTQQYEIYKLDANGHRVDLSHNAAENDFPVVSPDGKKVAFFSYKDSPVGQGARIFEARIDGTHLVDVAPSLSADSQPGSIAWQPHGDRLAAITNTYKGPHAVWILRPGHKPRRVATGGVPEPRWSAPIWSPDGRVLVEWNDGAWRAFNPNGKHLWTRGSKSWGGCCGSSWSRHGLLAITTRRQLRVYSESGTRRFQAHIPASPVSSPTWSPNGRDVAFVTRAVVEVRTANGRLVLRKRVPSLVPAKPNIVTWADNHRVVAGLPGTRPQEGVVVRTGKLWHASGLWLDPRSADGKLAIVTPQVGDTFAVGVEPVGGGPVKSYGTLPACLQNGPPATSLQFVGRTRSIVYGSDCLAESSDLYSMDADGTNLQELTPLEGHSFQPALAPDSTEIAYVWAQSATSNTDEIRVANVDGTDARVVATSPKTCVFDNAPTWSPDGTMILFVEQENCRDDTGEPELFTVPAAGGPAPHDLGVVGSEPAWGPTRIAYRNEAGGLSRANPDGSDPVVVASSVGLLAWSPDGRLAYTEPSNGTSDVTAVVGSTQVTLPFTAVGSLSWSPDGSRFAVAAATTAAGQEGVFTVGTDGSDPVHLTTGYPVTGVSWN